MLTCKVYKDDPEGDCIVGETKCRLVDEVKYKSMDDFDWMPKRVDPNLPLEERLALGRERGGTYRYVWVDAKGTVIA